MHFEESLKSPSKVDYFGNSIGGGLGNWNCSVGYKSPVGTYQWRKVGESETMTARKE